MRGARATCAARSADVAVLVSRITLFSSHASRPSASRIGLHQDDAGPSLLGRLWARGRAAFTGAARRAGCASRLPASADARVGGEARADLVRSARRWTVADRGSLAYRMADARRRSCPRRARARWRAAVDRRVFVGRAAGSALFSRDLRATG